jgi:hypothetical protein
MQDDLLERLAAMRDDEEADGRSPSGEGLFDRPPAGHDLLVRTERHDLLAIAADVARPIAPRPGGRP